MRYELKSVYPFRKYGDVLNTLFSSRFLIKEIYHERFINNIYFDTLGYSDYLANLHSEPNRKKYRIRWYGELKGAVKRPMLELKYKKGMTGGKKALPLPEYAFGERFSYAAYASSLRGSFRNDGEAGFLTDELLQRDPVLVNRYARRYFLTADGKFRITLDRDMWFYSYPMALRMQDYRFGTRAPNMVMEVKFESADAEGAGALLNDLKFRAGRNSKYINGMNALLFNSQLESI